MTNATAHHQPDSTYAWWRLVATLAVGTLACAGSWTIVVVIPMVEAEFGTLRAAATVPYTLMMVGFGIGTIVIGRMADRFGIVTPVIGAALLLVAGYVISGLAPNFALFTAAHFLLGLGSGVGFAPLMADISHWFVRRRGLAVVIAACGSYLAGSLWPLIMNQTIPLVGWRATQIGIGIAILVLMLPLSLVFRSQPSHATITAAEGAMSAARADLGVSPGQLQALLTLAGFACCMAMAMPQVHIVAYCGDLGYGVARGSEMLSLMLGLGIISRVGSGFLADRIGGAATLAIGSVMQGLALMLYLFFDGLASLYIISGVFGLFQGGIVPMYAVIAREFLPPREAGSRIGVIVAATIAGMAVGGYASGAIFDATASYQMAFLHGLFWNMINLALALWLVFKRGAPQPMRAAA